MWYAVKQFYRIFYRIYFARPNVPARGLPASPIAFSYLSVFLTGVCTVVLFLVVIRGVRLLKNSRRPMPTVFFTFGMAGMLLSNLYWIAYGLPSLRISGSDCTPGSVSMPCGSTILT